MTLPVVKTANESDEAGVIDVLKLAFSADPATRRVWPDPHDYLSHFSSIARAFGVEFRSIRICDNCNESRIGVYSRYMRIY